MNFDCGRFYSRRWQFILLLLSGQCVGFTLRVNMSVAAPRMLEDLNWTEQGKGLVLSSFYFGYTAGQIPASWFIQRYGAKWIFATSVFVPSILTLFVPMACRSSFSLALFIRCLIGLFQSAAFPACYHFYPVWIPAAEKTMMIPAVASGMYLGEILGFSLSGILIGWPLHINGEYWGGWQLPFYVFGLLGILWFPFWALLAYESPEKHPYITNEEKELIKAGKGYAALRVMDEDNNKYQNLLTAEDGSAPEYRLTAASTDSTISRYSVSGNMDSTHGLTHFVIETETHNPLVADVPEQPQHKVTHLATDEGDRKEITRRIPWMNFFTNPVSLTLFLNHWSYDFIGYTLLSEMPSFFTDVLGFDLQSAGILCVFPYLALFLGALSFGAMFQYLQRNRFWSTDHVRQTAECIAFAGSTTGLIICSFMENKFAAYAFMIVAQSLLGAIQVGLNCSYSDVAPNYSSALNSVGNTIGGFAGILGPIIVSELTTKYEGPWGWRFSFFLTGFLAAISLMFWSKYQTSKPVLALNLPIRD